MEKIKINKKEKIWWRILAENSMKKIWNNKKDDEVWSGYFWKK